MKHIYLPVTTAADGSGTATAPSSILGKLYAVYWTVGTGAVGIDATLTVANSATTATLLTLTDANASAWYYPRNLVHSEAGAALAGTAGGDRVPMVIAGKLVLTIAQGGDSKVCSLTVFYED